MSSSEATREVDRSGYMPMASLNDSSLRQKDAAANSSRRQVFRMIPDRADCQVKYCIILIR